METSNIEKHPWTMHVHVYTLYDSVYTMYMHGSYHISPQTFLRLIWQAWVHVHVHTRYDSVYAMYVHGDRWQEGCRSAGEGPARSWDSQESQGWLGLMESEVCLWSWTDVSVLCTYNHIHPCAHMYLVHTTTYIHEHVCTWYIQVCKFMNMYIHVHECSEIHKHVHTVFRHVCTVLPYPGRWVGFQMTRAVLSPLRHSWPSQLLVSHSTVHRTSLCVCQLLFSGWWHPGIMRHNDWNNLT
jgi:hypothetical protein